MSATHRTPVVLPHASKAFRERVVLDDVSFSMPAGHVWICGENCAGKSTLARLIVGLSRLDRGSIHLRAGMVLGYAAAARGLAAGLTCMAHLRFAARQAGVSVARAGEVAERFDLGQLRDVRAATLSTGQSQRLRVAVAMVRRPTLLLLDEAHIGLDDVGRTTLGDGIAEIIEAGGTVLSFGQPDMHLESTVTSRYVLARGTLDPSESRT